MNLGFKSPLYVVVKSKLHDLVASALLNLISCSSFPPSSLKISTGNIPKVISISASFVKLPETPLTLRPKTGP